MREILFRGQTRKYGEKVRVGDGLKLPERWVYGGVLQGNCSHSIIYGGENINNTGEGLDKWVVYTDTLGQFTGLYDSTKWEDLTEDERAEFTRAGNVPSEWKGKKIFEGDIVEIDGKRYEVKYMLGQFFVGINMPIAYKRFDCEVIGTIHDNPELLKDGE